MFPNLFKVSTKSGKYDVMVRFEPAKMEGKDKEAWDAMIAKAKEIAAEHFPGKKLSEIPTPFKQGDPEDKYINDPDSVYIRFGTTSRPSVVGPNPKVNLEPGDVYGGMICRVSFNPKFFDVDCNRGITFYLNNCQKVADGERKGEARVAAEDEFDSVEEDVAADLFS
jgi:hypothetical protein